MIVAASIACASALAGPTPQRYLGSMQAAQPTRAAQVRMVNGKIQMVGPWVAINVNPWSSLRKEGTSQLANLAFDSYEGTGGAGSTPTDGLYGETSIPEQPGARWFLGDTWVDTYNAHYFDKQFPNTNGQLSEGIDLVFYLNKNVANNKIQYVLVFTAEDNLDVTNPVPPATIYDGVVLDYSANPIVTGGGYYSNVDLTGSGITMTMPTDGKGYELEMLAENFDGTTVTFAKAAQPMLWGTKPLNPSHYTQYQWGDDDGSGTMRDGDFSNGTFWDYTFDATELPTAYAVTEGTELSTHNVSNIQYNPGSFAIIRGKNNVAQVGRPQAEIVADIPVPAGTANERLVRLTARMTSNGTPFNNQQVFKWQLAAKRNNVNVYDVLYEGKPVNAGTSDGVDVESVSIATGQRAQYIDANNMMHIAVRMYNPKPAAPGWTLKINGVGIHHGAVGPDPLGPGIAFSGN